ncbi:hypothetical protein AQUCO_01100355v1 [Aquilegia coerulea]|uniref:Uncharacterized protein n=1 Tax=Aquilegia coerulea TaxID=218851 RepID=A0A2G5E6R5_AQUCA|nr:hypothetical protein AQUCO_01100355v1 [Aquilegia coerulea]
MASLTSYCYKIILLILSSFFISYTSSSSSATHTTRIANDRFTKIFAFGDSYTDTGNTKSDTGPSGFMQVSKPPYGMTHFHHPTNRYTDGRLVIDFVTEELSLPYLPPYLDPKADKFHGVNFAVGGATAITNSFFVRNNLTLDRTPQSILTELAWFKKYFKSRGCQGTKSPECKALMTESLFWIGEIGANDFVYNLAATIPHNIIQKLAIDSITLFLKELLDMGAKYIVVQGIPTTGCLPLALTLSAPDDRDDIGCVASVNNQTYHHNSLLQVRLKYLRKRYPHAIISYADFWNAYSKIMKNTRNYGFLEPFRTCCGTGGPPYNFDPLATCGSQTASKPCSHPARYINWDGIHLTEAMYKRVADLLLHGGYTNPPFDFLLSSRRREG